MKKEQKKEVVEELFLYTDIDEVLTGSLEQVAQNILDFEKKWKARFSGESQLQDRYMRFNLNFSAGKYEGDSPELTLSGVRLETDDEYKKRIEKNERSSKAKKESVKKRKENQEKQELALLAKLHKKYSK